MSDKLRVAVVGLGVGFGHVAAYRELADQFEIVAVCDPIESKRAIALQYLGVPHGIESFDELLERDDLDVINICTPPNLHVEMVRRVLASGRHAICEKPLAGSVAEIDALAECERASSGRLMPIFQYRFRRVLAAGLAGKPYVASVETLWTRGADYYAVQWRGRFDTEMGGICILPRHPLPRPAGQPAGLGQEPLRPHRDARQPNRNRGLRGRHAGIRERRTGDTTRIARVRARTIATAVVLREPVGGEWVVAL